MPTWRAAPHLELVNRDLLDVACGKVDRYLLNAPFRHGKTVLVSHYFPAWLLLANSDLEVVVSGYGDNFASEFGWAVRDIVRRWGPEIGVHIRDDSKAKNRWHIQGRRGGMRSVGIGGSLMGHGFDFFVFDDLIKNAEEALSATINERNWQWFMGVAYNRQSPGARIVGSMVRWSRSDVTGRILESAKRTGEHWKLRRFPCVAEANDELVRKPGELLWPERVGWKIVDPIRKTMPRWFQACYQQKPDEEEGTLFRPGKWPAFLDLGSAYRVGGFGAPLVYRQNAYVFATVDWATSEKETSDFTAIGVFALTSDQRLLILDMVNRHQPLDKCPHLLAEVCRKWRPAMVAGEDDVLSLAMVNECRRHRDIPEVRRLPIQGRSKLQRCMYAITWAENGRVMRPQMNEVGAPPEWRDDYAAQLSAFTGMQTGNDDMVDVTGMACRLAEVMKTLVSTRQDDDYGVFAFGARKGGFG
jgi:phage terminase large subunit-like protein